MPSGKEDLEGLLTGTRGEMKSLPRGPIRGLSITQIVLGCLAIIAQIVILAVYRQFFNAISQGIWCGAAFVVCGIIGIVASKRPTRPWIVIHLVLCFLVCIFATAIITLSAITAAYNYGGMYRYERYYPDRIDYPLHQDLGLDGVRDAPSTPRNVKSDYPVDYPVHEYQDYENNPQKSVPGGDHVMDLAGTKSSVTAYPSTPLSGALGLPFSPNKDYDYNHQNVKWEWSHDHGPYFRYVLDVAWVVQFALNLLMCLLGIIGATVAVSAATLSCVPLCCDPVQKYLKEQQDILSADGHVTEFDQAAVLPIKVLPDMMAGLQASGRVTNA